MANSQNSQSISETQTEEIWKTIPQFPDFQASSLGRIRRIGGKAFRDRPLGLILRDHPDKNGYRRTAVRRDGKQSTVQVHRLVAFAFLEEPPSKDHQINHRNGVKDDNRPENLEWVTCKQNIRHSMETLGHSKQYNSRTKLDEDTVIAIHHALTQGQSPADIAHEFQISRSVVYHIKHRREWKETLKHLPRNYPTSRNGAKITIETARHIRRLLNEGLGPTAIARKLNVSCAIVTNLKAGKAWKDVE